MTPQDDAVDPHADSTGTPSTRESSSPSSSFLASARTVTRYWIHVDHPSCGYECCGGGKIEACEDDTEYGIWMKAEDVAPLLTLLAQQDEEIARLKRELTAVGIVLNDQGSDDLATLAKVLTQRMSAAEAENKALREHLLREPAKLGVILRSPK